MQRTPQCVERPGGSQEAWDGKRIMNEKNEYHNNRLSSSLGDGDGWFGNPRMEPDNRAVPFGKPGRLSPTTSGMPRLFT